MYVSTHYFVSVGRGWYHLLMGWRFQLSLRSFQVIKRSSNKVSLEGMWRFFFELSYHMIERLIKENKLWDMENTGFAQKQKSCTVVASKRSINVWSKYTEDNFRMILLFVFTLWVL